MPTPLLPVGCFRIVLWMSLYGATNYFRYLACRPLCLSVRRLGWSQPSSRFGGKWKTFRRFVPLENSQKKWKISKLVGSFIRLERSERNCAFNLHVSGSLYQFQVHGKNICHGQFAKQNGFPRAFTHVPVHSFFFLLPPPNDQRHTGKNCAETQQLQEAFCKETALEDHNSCPVTGFGSCLVHG